MPILLTPLQWAPQPFLETSLSIMYGRVLVCQQPLKLPHCPLFHDPLHGHHVEGLGKILVPYILGFRYCFSCTFTLIQTRLKPLPKRSLPVLAKSAFPKEE